MGRPTLLRSGCPFWQILIYRNDFGGARHSTRRINRPSTRRDQKVTQITHLRGVPNRSAPPSCYCAFGNLIARTVTSPTSQFHPPTCIPPKLPVFLPPSSLPWCIPRAIPEPFPCWSRLSIHHANTPSKSRRHGFPGSSPSASWLSSTPAVISLGARVQS